MKRVLFWVVFFLLTGSRALVADIIFEPSAPHPRTQPSQPVIVEPVERVEQCLRIKGAEAYKRFSFFYHAKSQGPGLVPLPVAIPDAPSSDCLAGGEGGALLIYVFETDYVRGVLQGERSTGDLRRNDPKGAFVGEASVSGGQAITRDHVAQITKSYKILRNPVTGKFFLKRAW